MKLKQLTRKQQSSVACPTCDVVAGERCVPMFGGRRYEPHSDRKLLAAEILKMKRTKEEKIVPKKTEKESDAAWLVRLKRELARPYLAKSVREMATRKQIASRNAV